MQQGPADTNATQADSRPWPPLPAGPLPQLPGYEVVREVGRGAMGVVYEARQRRPDRVVAVKMVLGAEFARPETLVRFLVEAEMAARVQHPTIVQIYEVGTHAGQPYFALEYVGGGTLRDRLQGRPFDPRAAAALVETLARAVHAAHQQGIVHRDLKPANVLLTADGTPKITDFGLAKQLVGGADLTDTGAVLGTPSYMAPEQAAADRQALGTATDVYALGAILYELLAGRPPFRGATPLDTILQVTSGDGPPRLSGLPRDLATVCHKCLEKDPRRRYPSAEALAEDLRRFLGGHPVAARPVGRAERAWRWCRRNPRLAGSLGAVAALLLVIAVGGVVLSLHLRAALKQAEAAKREGDERLLASYVAEARAQRFSRRVGQRFATLEALRKAAALARELDKPPEVFAELRHLAIAALALPDLRPAAEWVGDPDGKGWNNRHLDPRFRGHAVTSPQGAVSLRQVGAGPGDGGEVARLPGFGDEAHPEYSPDGRFLAVWHWRVQRLQVWRIDGEKPALACEEKGDCFAFGFSPDGRQLITAGRPTVLRIYALPEGRRTRSFPVAEEVWGCVAHHPLLPQVALAGRKGVVVVDLPTGKLVGRLPLPGVAYHLAWHPDGELLAAAYAAHIHVWDVPRQRQNWRLEHRGDGVRVAFNRHGDLLASVGWAGRLKLWDPHAGREVFGALGEDCPLFGAGDRLAVKFPEGWKNNAGPLTQVEAGREYRTLVAGVGRANVKDYRSCSLHPEGRLLAVGTQQGFSLMDLATGSERAFSPVPAQALLFEPSGTLLTNTPTGLFRWPIQADSARRLLVGPPQRVPVPIPPFDGNLARSADGAVLAGSNFDGAYVWRRDRPRAAIPLKPHGDCRYVAVSPDGRLVATGAHNGRGLKVWDARTGQLVRTLLPDTGWTIPAFSPDGRWLVNKDGHSWRVGDWSAGPRHPGGAVAFSPDGRLVAWAAQKGLVMLVDPETGHELARLEDPHQNGLGSLLFHGDGTLLIGTTSDGSCARVWDLRKIRQGLAELGLDWDAPPYPPEEGSAATDRRPPPVEVIGAMEAFSRDPANALGAEARRLVTGPAERRDPAKALPLALRAVELKPEDAANLSTLGAVQYRNRRYQEAVATLNKSLAVGKGQPDGWSLLFLAMCHHRLGDAAKARDCYDRALRWHKARKGLPPQHEAELKEFRAEAEAVLREPPES